MKEPSERADVSELRDLVRQLVRGRSNAVGQVRLFADATSTTVFVPSTVSARSTIKLTPRTAAAAAAVPTTYISDVDNGAFTITHEVSTADNRVFDWAAQG